MVIVTLDDIPNIDTDDDDDDNVTTIGTITFHLIPLFVQNLLDSTRLIYQIYRAYLSF